MIDRVYSKDNHIALLEITISRLKNKCACLQRKYLAIVRERSKPNKGERNDEKIRDTGASASGRGSGSCKRIVLYGGKSS